MLRLFLSERREPAPFYRALAERTVRQLPFDLVGRRVLDLGCGPGYYTSALVSRRACVVGVEFDALEVDHSDRAMGDVVLADARRLPLADRSIEGVFCSNMLEHTPDIAAVFDEIERVLVPGGWGWISWTNWYSPWGGHEISPLHYLGPRLGLGLHRRVRGGPEKNVPGISLFPTHIGSTLAMLRGRPGLKVLGAHPRYYPSQRWILGIPGFREVATWNCVLLLERTADAPFAAPYERRR